MSGNDTKPVVDPKALIHPGAQLDEDVGVGPFSIIGPNVRIASKTVVDSHVVIGGRTTIGRNNRIFPYASVGADPQDLKFGGEDSELIIGDGNTIRECVTINKGTEGGGMVTRLGNGILIMAYCHVAHDCFLEDGVIMANQATLAGHVTVEKNAFLGGMSGVHQFCRVGSLAMLAAHSYVNMDVAPYTTVQGVRARLSGLNLIGLKRSGMSEESISSLKNAYRTLFKSGLSLEKALEEIGHNVPESEAVSHLVDFLKNSERGVTR